VNPPFPSTVLELTTGKSFDFSAFEPYLIGAKNQVGILSLKSQRYLAQKDAILQSADVQAFSLHDTAAVFRTCPRVFTTLRVRTSDTPRAYFLLGLARHLSRLQGDAAAFHLRLADTGEILQLLRSSLDGYHAAFPEVREIRLRIIGSSKGIEIFLDPFFRRFPEDSAISVRTFAGDRHFPLQKTTCTETSVAAFRSAEAQGCHEALLINGQGKVSEGAWSNVWWFDRRGQLFTSGEAVLPGITRALLLEYHNAASASVEPAALLSAAEVFLSQSTHDIIPVGAIDGQVIGDGTVGTGTAQLSAWIRQLRSAESPELYELH
jgi:branched-subunit amino acid aminotransferase/4-amino-4-deoxychorismate lyase